MNDTTIDGAIFILKDMYSMELAEHEAMETIDKAAQLLHDIDKYASKRGWFPADLQKRIDEILRKGGK